MDMFKNKINFKLLNLLMVTVILYLIMTTSNYWLGIIRKIISLVFPFVLSFTIAYAFSPLVRKLERKGVRKPLAVAVIVMFVILLFGGLIFFTLPLVYDQLVTLSTMINEVISDLMTLDINLGGLETTVINSINNMTGKVGNYISEGAISFVTSSINFLTSFIVIFIVTIYFLFDMEKIRETIKTIVKRRNKKIFDYLKSVDHELGRYLEGLTIFMLIQFFEYSLLFWLVGHPNWILLGILASVTTVIPYFGGWITNIIAVVLASVVSKPLFITTLLICFLFPNIDGYVISPKVYGKTNNINPLWTIFSVTAMGSLFGVFGILIALPTYIVINCTYKFFWKDFKEKVTI